MQHQDPQPETPDVRTDVQAGGVSVPQSPMPQYISEQLFQGHRELLILHGGETYRLKVTRNGKLILNK
jgi:hemin uptake protein HemP